MELEIAAYVLQYFTMLILICELWKLKQQFSKRRWWVQPHITEDMRDRFGAYANLFLYFKLRNHEEFYQFTHMTVSQFDQLFKMVRGKLTKRTRHVRPRLDPELKLAAVLNYLAHGGNMRTFSWFYRIGMSTMYKLVPEVCQAIVSSLKDNFIKFPNAEEFKAISKNFLYHWQIPNCLGALDGKHVRLQCPPHGGSYFYNYKKFHSLVLMGASDAFCRFIWLNFGDFGHLNDASIFNNSDLGALLRDGLIDLPGASILPNTNTEIPHFFIGDNGFGLKPYLMTPFLRTVNMHPAEKIFNYRLSRARRIVECAFGILTRKWLILQYPLNFKLDTTENLIIALVCLHNFLITSELQLPHEQRRYTLDDDLKEEEEENILHEDNQTAIQIREILTQYFISPAGSVDWQWDMIQ